MKRAARDRSKKSRQRRVRVNFGQRTRKPPRMIERAAFDPSDQDWDDFDEILGNFGDWGSQ